MIPLLNQILSIINSIGNYVYAIYNAIVTRGLVAIVQDASTVAHDIQNLLNDPSCGQAAQCAKLDSILSDLGTLASDISSLGTPQQTGSPVTLPTTPPAGYGAPSSSSNASAVWAFLSTDESIQMGTIMSTLSAFTRIFRDSLALPGRLGSWATYNFDAAAFINNPNTGWVNIDAGTILPTHTDVLAWLNDIYFQQTWHDLGDSTYWSSVGSPSGNALVYVTMTQGEFKFLQYLNAHGVPGTNLAPVWPGLSGVTLGTPVSISRPGQTISVPCDGVIIAIATTETSAGKFSFDTAISWRNAGALSFFDDNGEQEFPQSLGFEDCVYVPQSMAHAAGVRLRYSSILTGTVTPFVIN